MVLLASTYDQSRFLKAADLEGPKKFRIKSVTEELIGPKQEPKLVVWFTNDQRGLVLNKTNNRTLRTAFGDAVDGWVGKIVVLFTEPAPFGGKPMEGLRVRIPAPSLNGGQPAAQPQPQQTAAQPQQPTAVQPQPAVQPPQLSLEDDLDDETDF